MAKNAATHFLNEDLAQKYGLDEAIFLNRLIHWIQLNKDNGNQEDIRKNTFRDGKIWSYNTQEALCKQFPFWNRHQVMRITKSLITQGIIVKGKYNKHIGDHTIWYALANEEQFLVERDCKNSNNRIQGNLQSGMLENSQSRMSENSQSYNDKDKKKLKREKLSTPLFIEICKKKDKGETLTKREKEFLAKYQEQQLADADIAPASDDNADLKNEAEIIETNPKMLEVHRILQNKLGDSVYGNWFKNKMLLISDTKEELILGFTTRFIKEFVGNNFLGKLSETITAHFGQRAAISLIVIPPK